MEKTKSIDEKYMARCLQLAACGQRNAAPNPMVGAVIVYNGKIIGEGYHIRCGEAHAEVNAIRSVKDPSLLQKATIYVSLEPCSHYGKTPPCADLIISKQIPRVVIGCMDPFSLVAGRGIAKLKAAGIEVTVGVLEAQCRNLIRKFITFNTQKRPYITLKWAKSANGYLDVLRSDGSPFVLSSEESSIFVHKQRAENMAIMVGRKTALLDNPTLTTRHWYGRNPVRLVIDKELSLPESLHLFDGTTPTWIFTAQAPGQAQIHHNNIEYIQLNFSTDILPQVMQILYDRKIQSLLVEGGSKLLQSFIDLDLWDEGYVEHTPHILNKGVTCPKWKENTFFEIEKYFGRSFLHYKNIVLD